MACLRLETSKNCEFGTTTRAWTPRGNSGACRFKIGRQAMSTCSTVILFWAKRKARRWMISNARAEHRHKVNSCWNKRVFRCCAGIVSQRGLAGFTQSIQWRIELLYRYKKAKTSELNVDNWNGNCEAKSEAKSPRPLRGLQVDFSLTRNVPYAVCRWISVSHLMFLTRSDNNIICKRTV